MKRAGKLAGLVAGLVAAGCGSAAGGSIETACEQIRADSRFCDRTCLEAVGASGCSAELDVIPAAESTALGDCFDTCPSEMLCPPSGFYTCACMAACAEGISAATSRAYGAYMACWRDAMVTLPACN